MKHVWNHNRIKGSLFVLPVLIALGACSKNEPIVFTSDMNFVAFSSPVFAMNEHLSAVNAEVVLASVPGAASTTVTVATAYEGLANPAVEGIDYTIASKEVTTSGGVAQVVITPINNEDFTGDKSFYLFIVENSAGYDRGANDTLLVTIKDDEHPLGQWIGEYVVSSVSYLSPGEYDETWLVTTEPDPEDVNHLIIKGIGGEEGAPIIATLNMDEMTISVEPGQAIGNVYGYGTVAVYKGTETGDGIVEDEPVEGIIESDGTIRADLWGHLITDGEYAGYLWDVFNTTWVKQ